MILEREIRQAEDGADDAGERFGIPRHLQMLIIAHMLRLRHVLNMMDDLPECLERHAEVPFALILGGPLERRVEEKACVAIRKLLPAQHRAADDLPFVLQRPVGRRVADDNPFHAQPLAIGRVKKMVGRAGEVVFEVGTVLYQLDN